MRIIISNEVKSAIIDIFYYSYYNISAKYARKIVDKIYKAIYDLKSLPYIGRYVRELPNNKFRERICENYRIIYYISESNSTVYIQYIFCLKKNSNLFFKVHEKELIKFLNQFSI